MLNSLINSSVKMFNKKVMRNYLKIINVLLNTVQGSISLKAIIFLHITGKKDFF